MVSEKLSSTISAVPASATLEMARISRELKATGVDVIAFSLGEPDQLPPEEVLQAARDAVGSKWNKYPPVNGYLDLREAICAKFKRDNGLDYTPDQIVVSTGAKQSLFNIVMSLISPGDKVVLPAPYWVSYEGQILMAGGQPVIVQSSIHNDFKPTVADMIAAIDDDTRLLIFSSPNNPSGSVMDRSELEKLADAVKNHPNLIVVHDEIYEHIVFEGEHVSFGSLPGMAERTVTVNGLSKAFSMTGWRIGYIGAPLWLAKACNRVQGQVTSGPNSISQRAAIAAVNCDTSMFNALKDLYRKRRDLVLEQMKSIDGIICNKPAGAFYVMPDVRALIGKKAGNRVIGSSHDLCMYLLETAHVALVDGAAFGMPGYIRMSYATSEELIIEGIARMKKAIDALV
jgi:aspartate aminotransferase